MTTLADRIEGLAGPDREVDAEIAKAVGTLHGPEEIVDFESRSVVYIDEQARPYTASIDAAMTLLPDNCGYALRKSIGLSPLVSLQLDGDGWQIDRTVDGWTDWHRGATPALALCAAAIRARTG